MSENWFKVKYLLPIGDRIVTEASILFRLAVNNTHWTNKIVQFHCSFLKFLCARL
jgi:hypothetical protein